LLGFDPVYEHSDATGDCEADGLLADEFRDTRELDLALGERTREIGIRMALGASPARVLRLMIRRGLLLIGLGIVFGLAAALALTKLMQSLLWGITATDPLTFGAVVMMLATVSLLACYVPARRALTMEPTVVLRHE
jgi:putative ABC transport system permease protein